MHHVKLQQLHKHKFAAAQTLKLALDADRCSFVLMIQEVYSLGAQSMVALILCTRRSLLKSTRRLKLIEASRAMALLKSLLLLAKCPRRDSDHRCVLPAKSDGPGRRRV